MQILDIQIDKNRKETTVHGSYDFPLAIYLDQLDKNVLGFVNWHWHEEIQLSLVTSGEVAFSVNQHTYRLKQGQGIFINSGCLHMSQPVTRPDSTYICINADARMLAGFPGSIIEQKYVKPFWKQPGFSTVILEPAVAWQQVILTKIAEIYELYCQKAFGYEIAIGAGLAIIWQQLVASRHAAAPAANSGEYADQQRIKAIMAYIHERYMYRLTLPEIAALINISQGECCRFFKRVVRCTIFEYIVSFRINRSIELLRGTDMSVSQIADAVGFGSTSYYIECFKKQVACTPKEYRKSYLSEADSVQSLKK